jgi:hypothetical protein
MKYSVEHIIHKLCETEVLLANVQTGKDISRKKSTFISLS